VPVDHEQLGLLRRDRLADDAQQPRQAFALEHLEAADVVDLLRDEIGAKK
jgi:hypothetical protein